MEDCECDSNAASLELVTTVAEYTMQTAYLEQLLVWDCHEMASTGHWGVASYAGTPPITKSSGQLVTTILDLIGTKKYTLANVHFWRCHLLDCYSGTYVSWYVWRRGGVGTCR